MRISGLATGMDTEQIIKDMMKAHRLPMEKITQKKQYLEWQLDDYRAVNRQLFDFSQNTFSNMILSTNFTAKTVSVSSPDAVAIKNLTSTSDFSGTIEVHQLAKNATMQSSGAVINSEADLNKSLKELKPTLTVPSTITIKAIKADGTFDTEGYVVKLDEKSTLQSVLDDINKNSGVSAFYDSFSGKVSFTAKNSGAVKGGNGNEIEFSGNYGFLRVEQNNTAAATASTGTKGANSEFTFNGLKTERSSNNFRINGFEVTLKQVTSPLDEQGNRIGEGKTVTFNSSPDTDKIFESVVKYVDEYNKLIEDLNKQIREPKYRSFQPLSDEQKKEMKEKEIELWEEKAKSGTLRNDSEITSMLTKMRSALMGAVDGKTLKDLGITTSPNYSDNGKLIINEDTLKKAIAEDPGKVHELFSKDAGEKAKLGEHGFARQLRMIVDESQEAIAKRAGKVGSVNDTFTLGKNLNAMNKQIERFEDRLRMTEDRLWKQFTAMERAIQRSNMQSASLMNAFGGQ